MSQSGSGQANESGPKPAAQKPGAAGGSVPASAGSEGAGSRTNAPAKVPAGNDAKDQAKAKEKTKDDDRAKAQAKDRRADWMLFRTAVALVGLLLAGFGVYFVLTGTSGLPEPTSEVNPTLESQFRFFAALLTGVGIAFLTIAIKFEWANVLWFVCAMVFIGGIARVISWALVGTPHVVMIVLMIVELAAPPVLVVWHRWVSKTQELKRSYSGGTAPR